MTLSRRVRKALGFVATGLATTLLSTAVHAETIKLLSSWTPAIVQSNFAIGTLTAEAKKLSHGKLIIKRFGPEIVPPFEQLQPVSAGTFDMLYTHPIYHAGSTAVGALMDIVVPDIQMRRDKGIIQWVDKYYEKHFGVKLLVVLPAVGFQFLLKEPIKPGQALEGRKIRTTPTYEPLVKTLGGATVTMPSPQIYTSMQKGLIDGAAYVTSSLIKQKLYEVAKYMARPIWGIADTFFMINLKKWNSLDSKTQKILMKSAEKARDGMPWFSEHHKLLDEQGMIEHGSHFTFFGRENAQRLTELFDQGVERMAVAKSGADAKAFIAMVRAAHMINH